MAETCPGNAPGFTDAQNLVANGWDTLRSLSDKTLDGALDYLGNLSDLNLDVVSLGDLAFSMDRTTLPSFTAPTKPELNVEIPGVGAAPSDYLYPVSLKGVGDAPDFKEKAPKLTFPTAPSTVPRDTTGSAPTLPDRAAPAYEGTDLPTVPSLRELDLPDVPTLTIPTFSSTAPDDRGISLSGLTFDYENTAFDDTLIPVLRTNISTWLAGGTGLPDAIWENIWERDRSRERVAQRAARNKVLTEWAGRGFTLPSGPLDAALREVELELSLKEQTLSRDVAIKSAEMEVENLRFAFEKGITFIQVLAEIYAREAERSLQAAKATLEASLSVFNAEVELYKAKLQAYQTEASVFKELVTAELARLDAYKAELEGQKLIGELNLQDVEIYKAQLQAVVTGVEVYKGEVEALKALVQSDTAKIDAYRANVEAYREKVGAYSAEVEAYAKRVSAEEAKAGVYETQAKAYGILMDAYRTESEVVFREGEVNIQNNAQRLELFKTNVQAWASEVGARIEAAKADVALFSAEASVYASEASVAQAASNVDVERYRLAIAKGQAEAEVAVEKARLAVEQVMRINTIESDTARVAATTYGQLASATVAGVNLSATVQGSATNSVGCQTSFNYSYDNK